MDDNVQVGPAEVVETYRDLVIYSSLKIAMPVSGADEMARNVVMVPDFWSCRIFVSLKRLSTNVKMNRIVVLHLLCARQSLHWNIVFKMINALSFSIDTSSYRLAERSFFDRMPCPCGHCLNSGDQDRARC